MGILTMFIIGLGLAMDAFAVSITSGVTIKNLKIKHALRIAVFFGGFQAIMPLIGWAAGLSFVNYVRMYSHWLAFIMLFFIGAKMVYEGFKIEECELDKDCLNTVTLLILAIATSIDALAVGVTFSVLKVAIILPVIIIGLVTFVLSLIGVYIGDRVGMFFEKKIEIFGGIILILMGVKIILERYI